MRQQKGFSLLEVMISIAIFSFISLATYSVITSTMTRKSKIEEYEDINHSLRVMFNIMRRDFMLAFNYIPTYQKLPATGSTVSGASAGGLPDPTGLAGAGMGVVNPNDPSAQAQAEEANMLYKPYKTLFLGKDNEVHFTSLGHRRLGVNAKESEQSEVSYFLFKDEENDWNNLVRRETNFIHNEPFKTGESNPVVEVVKSIKFRYYASDNGNWIDYWDSEDPSPTMKNKFPEAVEVSIDIDTSGDVESHMKITSVFTLDSSTVMQKPLEEKKGPAI